MKKRVLFLLVLVVLMVFPTVVLADKGDPPKGPPDKCTTIQSGELLASDLSVIETGYDVFGYNYQAHLFNGSYANVYLGGAGFPPYEGDTEAYLAENPAVTLRRNYVYSK